MPADLPAEDIPYSLETYVPHVGSDVEVLRGTEWGTLSLAVAEASNGHVARTREMFSLLFAGSKAMPLVQGTHAFRHPVIGAFELFITPIIPQDRERHWYEATINRGC
jgi:hypothetical protein